MKQEPQSNIINYGLPANMYTKTEAFNQDLFLSKSEAAIHYGSHYHRQRSFECSSSLLPVFVHFQTRLPSDVSDDVDEDPTGNKALWDRGCLNGASQKVKCLL